MRKIIGIVAVFCAACGDASPRNSAGEIRMNERNFVCGGMDAREVLNTIRGNGAVLTNSREGVFHFYGPANVLPKLQQDLESLGFSVRPATTEPGRIATINAVIDEDWLARIIPQLCKMTEKTGIEYDGWEASIPEAQAKK